MDLFDICDALNKHNVDYLIIGGEAVNLYGVDRGTQDYDIWVDHSLDNFSRLTDALEEVGYIEDSDRERAIGKEVMTLQEFFHRKKLVKLEHPDPSLKPLDIFCDPIDGGENDPRVMYFDDCQKRKHSVTVDGTNCHFVSEDDLIKLKKIADRDEDWEDIRKLENATPKWRTEDVKNSLDLSSKSDERDKNSENDNSDSTKQKR